MTTEEPRPPMPSEPASPSSATGAGADPPTLVETAIPRQASGADDRSGATQPAGPEDGSPSAQPAGPEDRTAAPQPSGPEDRTAAPQPAGPEDRSGAPQPSALGLPTMNEVERAAALAALGEPSPRRRGRRFPFFHASGKKKSAGVPPAAVSSDVVAASPEPGTGQPGTGQPGTGQPGTGQPGTGQKDVAKLKEPFPSERPPGAPIDPWTAFASAPERPPGLILRATRAFFRSLIHEYALAIYAGLLLAVGLTWPTLRYPMHTLPEDLGDPARQAWQISWIGHILLTHPRELWQSNAFYPQSNSFAFGDSLLGYGPVGMLGDGPLAATLRYNILFVLAHALLAIGGYALVRQLGAGRTGAAVAAVAIAYAPWHLAQEGHLDIISAGGIPLALAMLARGHGWSLRRGLQPRERNAGWAAFGWLVATWQVSLGFSLGLPFLGVLGLIVLLLFFGTPLIWLRRRSRRRAHQRRLVQAQPAPAGTIGQPDAVPGVSAAQPGLTPGVAAAQPGPTPGVAAAQPGPTPGMTAGQPGPTPGATSAQPSVALGVTAGQPGPTPGVTAGQPDAAPGVTAARPDATPGAAAPPSGPALGSAAQSEVSSSSAALTSAAGVSAGQSPATPVATPTTPSTVAGQAAGEPAEAEAEAEGAGASTPGAPGAAGGLTGPVGEGKPMIPADDGRPFRPIDETKSLTPIGEEKNSASTDADQPSGPGERAAVGAAAGGDKVAGPKLGDTVVDGVPVGKDAEAAKGKAKKKTKVAKHKAPKPPRVRAVHERDFSPVLGWRLLIIDSLGPVILAGIAALIALPYFHLADKSNSTAEIRFFSPPLWSLLIGPSESRIWGSPHAGARGSLGWAAEMSLLPGFVLYALALAGLWFSVWKFSRRILLIIALAASMVLTMGTNFFGGRWTYLPLFGHLPASLDQRIPGRMMLWVTLLLGILAAGAVSEFVRRAEHWSAQRIPPWPAWWLRLATLVPLILVLGEGWNTTSHPVVPAQPASMRTITSPMLVLPTGAVTDGTVMLWSTTRYQRIANGSGGFAAAQQAQMRSQVASFPDAASIEYLRSIHVATVLLVRSSVAGTPWERAGDTPVDSLGITREDVGTDVVFHLR
jgi:hypothetical protein